MRGSALFRCEAAEGRWAPLWTYVVPIVPIVAVQQQVLRDDTAWWYRLAISLAIVAANVGVITALHRRRRSADTC
ncbi:MAG TPA: hypothetical protein VFW80_11270 [Gaiellaceae bacterium]|nr:hypothetical protein [Gaiellaceae bacterium]